MHEPVVGVMACYNPNPYRVEKAVRSIMDNSVEEGFRLVLIDNHSPSRETRQKLKSLEQESDNVEVLDAGRNIGKSKAFELTRTRGKLPDRGMVAVLDDDIEVLTHGWDQRMASLLKDQPRLGSVGAYIEEGGGMPSLSELRPETMGGEKVYLTDVSVGGWMTMYRSEVLKETGVFLPRLYGGEDFDMTQRLRSRGYMTGYMAGVRIKHFPHEDREFAEWKREHHDGRTALDYEMWKREQKGEWLPKLKDVALTRLRGLGVEVGV